MRKFILAFLSILMALSTLAVGCKPSNNGGGGGNNPPQKPVITMQKGVHYSDQIGVIDENTGLEKFTSYDKDVFYRNDAPEFVCADTFVYYCNDTSDTENYGKYFLYGTTIVGIFNCWVSDDLVSWEPKAPAYTWPSDGWEHADCWAPEIVWDKDADPADYNLVDDGIGQGVYYFFYSASSSMQYIDGRTFQLGLAVGTSPYGPFTMYNGKETGAVINGKDYSTEEHYGSLQDYTNSTDGFVGRKGDTITNDDPWWNDSAFRASLTFQYQNRDKAGTVVNGTYINEEAKYMVIDEGYGQRPLIDPSPFIDPVTGDRYLYVSVMDGMLGGSYDDNGLPIYKAQSIYVLKMKDNDWAQIDYSSAIRCSRSDVNMISEQAVEAYKKQANAFDPTKYVSGVKEDVTDLDLHFADAELLVSSNGCNEGPFVYYNPDTGLYYMAISVSTYTSASYSLIELVAYKPTGPWRKLDLDEGGLMLATYNGISVDNVTGPGHHSFIKTESDLLNVYHKHLDIAQNQYNRGPAVDRVVWVKNSKGMTIMHTNGPTTALQPKFYGVNGHPYDIISDSAIITTNVSSDKYNSLSYLNDNVISIHNNEIHPHINDFKFTSSSTTINLKFDAYRQINSVMVYNATVYEETFLNIKKIEMDFKKDGVEGTAVINDLGFYWERYSQQQGGNLNPGGAAIAAFSELAVKEIRITIDNPGGEGSVCAIPEICVTGRPEVNANAGAGNATADTVKLDNYTFSDVKPLETFEGVTLDGIITEEEWGSQNVLKLSASVGGVQHDVEASVKIGENGLLTYWKVFGAPVYFNPSRNITSNSGIELFIADGKATSTLNNAWQIELYPNGKYGTHLYIKPGSASAGYKQANKKIYVNGMVDGAINTPNSNGYIVEAYMPWSALGIDEAPESIRMDGAIMYCTTYNGERQSWYSLSQNLRESYGWTSPQTWYLFDKDGWYDDVNFEGQDWRVTKYDSNVTVDDDGKVTIVDEDQPWNIPGTVKVYRVEKFVGEVYQQVKVYSPGLQNNNLNDKLSDPEQESSLTGLFLQSDNNKVEFEVLYDYGVLKVRFAGPYWNKFTLNQKQIDLYKTVGLDLGLYFDGDLFIGYIDDGDGNMVSVLQADASLKSFTKNSIISLGITAKCDSYYTDYVCYGDDDIKVIPHVINNGEALTNGKVTVSGGIKDGATVLVTPDDGYALESLTVNGVQVNALKYTIAPYYAPTLDIQVTFKKVDGLTATFTVDYGFAYTDKTAYKNLSISLSDGVNIYYGLTNTEGVASFAVPNGSYTVLADGCLPQTLVINNVAGEDNAYNITLIREVITSLVDGVVVTDKGVNGADLVYDKTVDIPFDLDYANEPRYHYGATLDFDGLVYTSFNLKIQTNVKCCVSIQFTGNGNSEENYYCNFVVWDNAKIVAKPFNSSTYQKSLTPTIEVEDGVQYASIDVTVLVDGSSATIYYKQNDGVFSYLYTMDSGKDITGINLRSSRHQGKFKATNILVYDGVEAINLANDLSANLSVANAGNSTVTIGQSKILFGKQTDIIVTPNGDYAISSIKINGKDYDFTTNADGSKKVTFTHNNLSVKDYEITITTVSATTVSANITLKTKKVYTDPVQIADGITVTVTGTMGTYTAVTANGKINIPQILSGDYKISVPDYSSLLFSVGSNGFDGEVVLGYIALTSADNVDVSGSGLGRIQYLKGSTNKLTFKESNIYYVEARIVDVLDTSYKAKNDDLDIGGVIFRFGTPGESGKFSSWGTQLLGPNAKHGGNGSSFYNRLRWTDADWGAFNLTSDQQTALTTPGQGLKIALAIVGDKAYGFVENGASFKLVATLTSTSGNWGPIFGTMCEQGLSTITEFYYSPTVPQNILSLI